MSAKPDYLVLVIPSVIIRSFPQKSAFGESPQGEAWYGLSELYSGSLSSVQGILPGGGTGAFAFALEITNDRLQTANNKKTIMDIKIFLDIDSLYKIKGICGNLEEFKSRIILVLDCF